MDVDNYTEDELISFMKLKELDERYINYKLGKKTYEYNVSIDFYPCLKYIRRAYRVFDKEW